MVNGIYNGYIYIYSMKMKYLGQVPCFFVQRPTDWRSCPRHVGESLPLPRFIGEPADSWAKLGDFTKNSMGEWV
jgi:hypothetical protein